MLYKGQLLAHLDPVALQAKLAEPTKLVLLKRRRVYFIEILPPFYRELKNIKF